ncbi:coadhesin-like isoform X2 [Clytia hemisphaerica]|uniref:coadhesin-like isoform X2 n=1 Tax=Clytia hemisphaerica TaxID=252671 RepID=UPI0034D7A0F8
MYCWILLIFTHILMYGEASTLQTYNSGIRFECKIFPGFYIGFEENEILENSNETLLYLKEDSMVSNRTLWFVEKQIECNKNDYDGFYLRSYTYPQYYMSLTIKNTLQLTRSSDSKACLIAADKENAHQETKGNCDSAGGAWSIWSDWSLCSSSCGNDGIQKRYRKCFSDQCLIEFDVDIKTCNRQRCPVQADYYTTLWKCYYWPPVHGQWSNWSTVNETFQNETTCPGKLSFATRQCDSPTPEYCGMYCGSSSIKIDIFPVDGGWSSWSGFSSCTLSCGSGTQYRTRACDNPASQYGGKHCEGYEREEKSCNTNPCPVDGGWSSWSGFSSCTLSCGSGTQYRTRACDNPASQYGGKHCEGYEREEKSCNTNPCPVDGGWSSWSGFSSCTLSCGSGTQYRTRACDNPASQYGGKHCEGHEREEKSCNINPCSAWSSWSCQHCSKTAIRTRTCHHGCSGKTTETTEMCQIESSCFPDKVLSYNTDLWGSWRSWEYCPKGTWVVRLQTRIESHQGDGDDTALNAISLRCNNDVGTTITSGYTNWGTWRAESQKCINGFYGGMLKFESHLGPDDDDTSTNAIRLICRDDNQWYESGEGGWGSWTQSTYCPAGLYRIVGLQTQIESDQGSDDDTSLNGVRLLCRYFG